VPRELGWIEWEDGHEPLKSRKRPGTYSAATRQPGERHKAGEVTFVPATDVEKAALTDQPRPSRRRYEHRHRPGVVYRDQEPGPGAVFMAELAHRVAPAIAEYVGTIPHSSRPMRWRCTGRGRVPRSRRSRTISGSTGRRCGAGSVPTTSAVTAGPGASGSGGQAGAGLGGGGERRVAPAGARAEEERDILRKAARYFAGETRW
jgi:hypothetical protein